MAAFPAQVAEPKEWKHMPPISRDAWWNVSRETTLPANEADLEEVRAGDHWRVEARLSSLLPPESTSGAQASNATEVPRPLGVTNTTTHEAGTIDDMTFAKTAGGAIHQTIRGAGLITITWRRVRAGTVEAIDNARRLLADMQHANIPLPATIRIDAYEGKLRVLRAEAEVASYDHVDVISADLQRQLS